MVVVEINKTYFTRRNVQAVHRRLRRDKQIVMFACKGIIALLVLLCQQFAHKGTIVRRELMPPIKILAQQERLERPQV